MSLLLKALSRAETKLSETAVKPLVSPVPTVDEQIAPVDSAPPQESPVSPQTSAAATETTPEVSNQEIAASTPASDSLSEDLPIAETIAAVDELGLSTDDAVSIDDSSSMYDEPPQVEDLSAFGFAPLNRPSEANETKQSHEHEEVSFEASEPNWEQLDKLHDLLSAHIAQFDLSAPQSKSPATTENTSAPPAANISEPVDASLEDSADSPELTLEFPQSIVPPPVELPPAPELKTPEPVVIVQEPVAPAKTPVVASLSPAPVSSPAPAVVSSAVKTPEPVPPAAAVAQLNIRPEYRELRDQLLARMNTSRHSTVLFVDAGRTTCDATWLLPLATSIFERWNATRATGGSEILLVEAGGPQCGLSQTLGLDTHVGLNHVLTGRADWRDAIQPTLHPQIQLLCRGAEQVRCDDPKRLAKLWTDLSRQYDLILVAAGPINAHTRRAKPSTIDDAVQFFTPATAAVLCVELNGTSQTAALEAKRSLDARGIQVLGCIVQPN